MNVISMRIPIFRAVLLSSVFIVAGNAAASPADELYQRLERHLQSLKTLEIEYTATGEAIGDVPLQGRMIWRKPDQFYHDTAEWTLCETGDEEWRYLKSQNTLILEISEDRESWTPETMLLNFRKDLKPTNLETSADGVQILFMKSSDPTAPQNVVLEFESNSAHPKQLRFETLDGADATYIINNWNDGARVDTTVFAPPTVPEENRIDFRKAHTDR